jgi:hypothetical protein
VPDPDISSLSDSTSEGLESSSEELDSRPDPHAHWIARLAEILKRNNAVRDAFERSTGILGRLCTAVLARTQLSFTLSITTKTILKADQNGNRHIGGRMPCVADGRWRLPDWS